MSKSNEAIVFAKIPSGVNEMKNTWKIEQCEYPVITEEGQFIGETISASVDPYMSGVVKRGALAVGAVQSGYTVAKVIESKNSDYPVGTVYVAGGNPWKRFFLVADSKQIPRVKILQHPSQPETVFTKLGYHSALGAFGMPAQTAYYGILDVGKLKESDVLVVSGAAGAVGMVVGQIAKNVVKCKKVIGIAGGKEKCDLLVKEFGFDAAIDYKEHDSKAKMTTKLKELAGDSISVYFDNTGGFITDAIFDVIAKFGRILVCGQISMYTTHAQTPEQENVCPNYLAKTIYKLITISGFVVTEFIPRNEKEFYPDMTKWLESGQVKSKETFVSGFENIPNAYEMLFTGANIGKVIVNI